MAIRYLKQAVKSPSEVDAGVAATVSEILSEIESGGEAATHAYAERFDGWSGEIALPEATLDAAASRLPETVKDDIRFAHARVDIRFAHARVRAFACHQRDSQQEFEVDLIDGLRVGKFVKVLTYQRMTRAVAREVAPVAAREVAPVAARISRLEGMEGHAMTGDARLAKYYPDEEFVLTNEEVA